MTDTEALKLVIDEAVAIELMQRGHNLLAQLPSETVEDRRVYVFANTPQLDKEMTEYDESTYYA
ncbi:hypothetical protein [Sporosarcina sp. SAFN-010]|uniref:hypothetical protein n=1 Tax=Sporosarcina sp. SAFN-010 TaxID=3387273 RepID=UPI003F7D37F0